MSTHALLSASSSHRWINCPPSARLCESYKDKISEYAAEGTEAHSLCEYKLQQALGIKASNPTEHLSYYSAEMEDCADGYVAFIMELVEDAKLKNVTPIVLIEQRLDYSRYVYGGFGTGDCVIVANGTLHIVDYKHGKGVQVESDDNPQMLLYALGALEIFDCLYDIDTISMTLYQPRRANISTSAIAKEALYQWVEETLIPAAQLAHAGEGNFRCGDWCKFCKAKQDCRKRAEYNMELARYDFLLPPLLEDEDIAMILGRIDGLVSWANDIKEYALQAAMGGKDWTGFKLVEGRSNRKYTNEAVVTNAVQAAGFDPYEHKVLGITAMASLLGKKRFEEILGCLIEKPQGKPTLVPTSDKRSAIHTAKNDFNEFKEDN